MSSRFPLFSLLPVRLRSLERFESRKSSLFCEAAEVGAAVPAGPECVHMHRPFGGLPAPADRSGHRTHLPALHPHRGQTHHQPEKLRCWTTFTGTHIQFNLIGLDLFLKLFFNLKEFLANLPKSIQQ